jgi:hypothetical protein
VPGQLPDAGLWLLAVPLALVAGMIGNIAIAYLALRPATSVAEALQRGLRRFLPLLGAALMLGLGLVLMTIVLAVIIVGVAGITPGDAADQQRMAVLLSLMLLPILLFLGVRLLPTTPIAASEEAGPIGIIQRAWSLTAGHFWRLLGFLLLLLIAAMVIMIAITAVFGIIVTLTLGSPMEPATIAAYVMAAFNALVQAVVVMITATLIARIYAQLSADSPIEA